MHACPSGAIAHDPTSASGDEPYTVTNIEYSIRTNVSGETEEDGSRAGHDGAGRPVMVPVGWNYCRWTRGRRDRVLVCLPAFDLLRPVVEPTSMSGFNLADLWEAVADRVPDRVALRCGELSRTYAQLEEQSNRLAHWYLGQGVQAGDHIGLYVENCVEYVEAMMAAYKVRAVPININYRYTARELEHLFNDADLVGVVHQWGYTNRVTEVEPQVPTLRWKLAVGSTYDDALASSSPARDFGPRSGDDHYILYTGGTTGLPKGVVWRQEDAFFACMGGGNPALPEVTSVAELVQRIAPDQSTFLLLAPLMHAAGGWVVLLHLFSGNRGRLVVGLARPAPRYGARSSERRSRPPARWGTRSCDPCLTHGTTSIQNPTSNRWPWSARVARPCRRRCAIGFSRRFLPFHSPTGMDRPRPGFRPGASSWGRSGRSRSRSSPPSRRWYWTRRPTSPWFQVRAPSVAWLAPGASHSPTTRTQQKSAATFVEWEGRRWSLTGDMGTVADDGTITLLGRGNLCINTGGEKVYPEEVEGVLRQSRAVYDVVVVGAPDERWGERVVAVVQPTSGTDPNGRRADGSGAGLARGLQGAETSDLRR